MGNTTVGRFRKIGRTVHFAFEIDGEIAKHFTAGTTMRIELPEADAEGERILAVRFEPSPESDPIKRGVETP